MAESACRAEGTLATARLDHQATERVRVTSACSARRPAQPRRHPGHGRDWPRHLPRAPKPLPTGKVQAADVVFTMGCDDACPIYPSERYEDRGLPDPSLDLEAVRCIREPQARDR